MAQNQPEFESYLNRIVDFGFKSGTFTPDGQSDAINYIQTVLVYEIDGEREELVLSGQTPPKPKNVKAMLRGADKLNRNGNLLDDNE